MSLKQNGTTYGNKNEWHMVLSQSVYGTALVLHMELKFLANTIYCITQLATQRFEFRGLEKTQL